MTIWMVFGFLGLHGVLGMVQWIGDWAKTGEDAGFVGALSLTPLKALIGAGSTFSKGLTDLNPLSPLGLAVDAVRFMFALATYDYAILQGGGLAGMLGTVLQMGGLAVVVWLLFTFAKTVAGSLPFGR